MHFFPKTQYFREILRKCKNELNLIKSLSVPISQVGKVARR